MKAAHAYAELSHAKRLKVGAVLVREDRVVSVGYNGTPSGRDNKAETYKGKGIPLETKPEVVHAEMNVIAFAARHGWATDGCSMMITHSPCYECSKLIVQAGIVAVYYEEEYRIKDGVDFLRECGLTVEKI